MKHVFKALAFAVGASLVAVGVESHPASGRFGALFGTIQTMRSGKSAINSTLGISGSGRPVALGTIDGFGSIFVNGVEFETDDAQIFLDGQRGSEADLDVGMVVLVKGSVNADGKTGIAETVIFDDEVEGPIAAISMNTDGDAKLITVLGADVIVEKTGTVFEGVTFDTLAVGDVVEVSGFPEGIANLRATRVEKKSSRYTAGSQIEVKGSVSGLTDTTLMIRDQLVDYSGAKLSEFKNRSPADGDYVEVKGILQGNTLVASYIELEGSSRGNFSHDDDALINDGDDYSIQGAVRNYVSDAQFEVNGVVVDASNAVRVPSGLRLINGVAIGVQGSWQGERLIASRIEARRGDLEIEASIVRLDAILGTVSLELFGGTVTVETDVQTLLDDDTGSRRSMTFSDLRLGDFVEIEAVDLGDRIIATRIDRDYPDDVELQAAVESFSAPSTITVAGLTVSVSNARFEGKSGANTDADSFFADLAVGDLVKLEDRNGDGAADNVEFENAGRPDGGYDFDDDDEDDDSYENSWDDTDDGDEANDDDFDNDSSEDDDDGGGDGDGDDNDGDDD